MVFELVYPNLCQVAFFPLAVKRILSDLRHFSVDQCLRRARQLLLEAIDLWCSNDGVLHWGSRGKVEGFYVAFLHFNKCFPKLADKAGREFMF